MEGLRGAQVRNVSNEFFDKGDRELGMDGERG